MPKLGEPMNYLCAIIVVAHNQIAFISETLQSIERQTVGIDNLQVILVSDGSNDGTDDILLSFQKKYPENVQYLRVNNLNVGKTRNDSLELVTSQYLFFLDGDDTIVDTTCEIFLHTIKKEDGIILSHLNEFTGSHYQKSLDITSVNQKTLNKKELLSLFLNGHFNGHIGGMFISSYLLKAIKFPEFCCYEDSYIFPDIIDRTPCIFSIDAALYNYRKHNHNTTKAINNEKAYCRIKNIEKLNSLPVNRALKFKIHQHSVKQIQILLSHTQNINLINIKNIERIMAGIPTIAYLFSMKVRFSRKKIHIANMIKLKGLKQLLEAKY